ncbi:MULTISPECIES: GTP-binding protein [unclassified Dehalobacter]|uniref:GTP-binding protein n=1 Tax=unclassified Dehalobacter TaxID=2635733 RepID=UPI0009FD9453|nr:hypothetical protein C1I36_06170 [Dehalobacter sp. 14DCB1]TCX52962.1 hypothetical protein C1I38_07850 [Dehalobacter sp. 12DCB1]
MIETTGVAFPSNVSEALSTHLRANAQITVIIDAGRWQRLRISLENLIIGQLSGAHTVLINKTDLVSPEEAEAVEKDAREINGNAIYYHVSGIEEIGANILQAMLDGES